MAPPPLPESPFIIDHYGGIAFLQAEGAVEIARRRDSIAKRSRDEGLPLSEEGDARGWSSAVLDRDLALRRRRDHASSSRRGRGLIVGAAATAAADEHRSCAKESTPVDSLAAKAGLNAEMDDSFLTNFYLNVL